MSLVRAGRRVVEYETGVVEDAGITSFLDGHKNLTGQLLLLESQFLCLVHFLIAKLGVVGFRCNVGGFDWLDSNSVHFVDDRLLIPLSAHVIENDSIRIPLNSSGLPSGVGSFESVGAFFGLVLVSDLRQNKGF